MSIPSRHRTGANPDARTTAVLVAAIALALAGCSSSGPSSSDAVGVTATPTDAGQPTATSTEPQPAGEVPDAYSEQAFDGVHYLQSFNGAGDAVAHEVVATVGSDGCLYFETMGYGSEVQPWLGVIGSGSIEVVPEGIMVGGEVVPYGSPFQASTSAIPPLSTLPESYLERCAGAQEAWSITE